VQRHSVVIQQHNTLQSFTSIYVSATLTTTNVASVVEGKKSQPYTFVAAHCHHSFPVSALHFVPVRVNTMEHTDTMICNNVFQFIVYMLSREIHDIVRYGRLTPSKNYNKKHHQRSHKCSTSSQIIILYLFLTNSTDYHPECIFSTTSVFVFRSPYSFCFWFSVQIKLTFVDFLMHIKYPAS